MRNQRVSWLSFAAVRVAPRIRQKISTSQIRNHGNLKSAEFGLLGTGFQVLEPVPHEWQCGPGQRRRPLRRPNAASAQPIRIDPAQPRSPGPVCTLQPELLGELPGAATTGVDATGPGATGGCTPSVEAPGAAVVASGTDVAGGTGPGPPGAGTGTSGMGAVLPGTGSLVVAGAEVVPGEAGTVAGGGVGVAGAVPGVGGTGSAPGSVARGLAPVVPVASSEVSASTA